MPKSGYFQGFNPRTHEGCDGTQVDHEIPIEVSIHAPTRGATDDDSDNDGLGSVSIHAPTRGATLASKQHDLASRFQSTHPRGVRQFCRQPLEGRSRFQSTHPRGVRQDFTSIRSLTPSFNPRTHEGCDLSLRCLLLCS